LRAAGQPTAASSVAAHSAKQYADFRNEDGIDKLQEEALSGHQFLTTMENLRLAAASLPTATRCIFMSHLTIGAVKGAIHSLAILASVPAAVLGIVGLVGFCIEGAAHSSIPLEPTAYDSSIKDVWGDVFGDDRTPNIDGCNETSASDRNGRA
jgi:hypothetical protein